MEGNEGNGGAAAGTGAAGAGAGAGATGGGQSAEPMVSAALLDQARGELATTASRLEELEGQLATLTSERDTALTANRRLRVRAATGIDDDTLADMAHQRYTAAVEGLADDKRPDLSKWWSDTAADETARGALPRALSVYMSDSGAAGGAGAGGGQQRRQPGTPGTGRRLDPRPGGSTQLGVDEYQRMSPEQQREVQRAFFASARRRTR